MPLPNVVPKVIVADPAANRWIDQLLAVLNPLLRNVEGDLSGALASPAVVGWRGLPLSDGMSSPAVGQVPKWNGSAWEPGTAGTAGAVTSVAGATPLSSSGGSTPTISLTGTVGVGNGGTGFSSYVAGELLFASGVSTLSRLTVGSAGQVLGSDGSLPTWITPTASTTGASVGGYRTTSSTPAAFALTDYVVDVTASGAFVLTLPTAGAGAGQAPTGRVFVVKNTGGATITVTPAGAQLIDTAATFVVQTQFASFSFISTGSGWAVL